MTDAEMQRIKAICDVAGVDDIGKLSDGYHTFDSLYEQRMVLFAALVKAYKNKAWKSYRHEDGEYCFGGGWFIVGIDTPEGSYTYHYENKYWDMFDCIDLPRAKHWDGHTEADAETRLMSLEPKHTPKRTETHECDNQKWQDGVNAEKPISITWYDKTARKTRLYCKKSGYLCEFATEYGYCQITVCVKEPLAGRRTDDEKRNT